MYIYYGPTGERGRSEAGSWFAMIEALGRKRAAEIVENSTQMSWTHAYVPIELDNDIYGSYKSCVFEGPEGEYLGTLYVC